MQQDVLFSILMILLNKRKVSRDYLADRFSVSKRTVSRYIRVLEGAGVPINVVPGKNGGIMLYDDYVFDSTFFTEAEAIRIKDALNKTAELYGDGANAAIADKIDTLDKNRASDSYSIKQSNLYIDCDYEQASTLKPRLQVLSQAIDLARVVDIKYTDSRGYESFRSVEPYTLVFKAGAWYLYAMCRLRGDFRLFKLSRISDMRMTSKSFVKTESKLTEKLGLEYYNEIYIDLEFEFFSSIEDDIVDWLGAAAIKERGTKLFAAAEVPYTDALFKRLLGFGSSVRVINPPELAGRIRDEVRRMSETYLKDDA